jgi:sirohydrochlorin ferrochelatase
MKPLPPSTAVIVIDHGSKKSAANDMLLEVVAQYQAVTGTDVVEPAHMELAEPTLAQAVGTCVARGATTIVVHPYFLAPGRHSTGDIPQMVAAVAADYPEVTFHVTAPLGIAPEMAQVMQRRIEESLAP